MADGYLLRTNEGYYSHCDEVIERIKYIELDLLKESYEFSAIYCGRTQNYFAYRNYMANNPIVLNMGGGGDVWEDVIFGSGGAIDIHGKKIGVFGDSLTDSWEVEIKECIQELGGEPVCIQWHTHKGGKGQSHPKETASLIGGYAFSNFSQRGTSWWSMFKDCAYVFTDLITNDANNAYTPDKLESFIQRHMSKCDSTLKGAGSAAKVISWGIPNFCCSALTSAFIHLPSYAKEHGDSETIKLIRNQQRNACRSVNWIYVEPPANIDEEIYNLSKKNHDVHVTGFCKGGYKAWFGGMLKASLGAGGGSNCPWTKEQLDKWRAEGTLSQNTGGRIRWDAARGVYQILTHRGYSGGSPTGGFLGAWSGALPDKVKRICELAMKGDFRHGSSTYNLSQYRKSFHGWCTSGPSTWYEDGAGIKLNGHWWAGAGSKVIKFDDTKLGEAGMQCIWKGTYQEFTSKFDSNEQAKASLRPADVATLYTGIVAKQHGMMWTGQDWRSDFAQNRGWCYGPSGSSLDIGAAIWRHPDLWPAQSNGPSNTSNINYSGDLPRWIDTSYNARDLGGWPAANGRKVKSGILFRGQGGLPMSKAQENGITCTINLNKSRYTIDRKLKCYDTGDYHRPELQSSKTAGAIQFLIDNIKSGGKCYIHCARGMDRTGMFCGALLSALGVSETNVNKDYHSLKTTYRWTPNKDSAYQGGVYKGNIWSHFASKQSELQNLLLE